jgi:hypothetical protein
VKDKWGKIRYMDNGIIPTSCAWCDQVFWRTTSERASDPVARKRKILHRELAVICRLISQNDSVIVTVAQLSTGIKNDALHSSYSQALTFPDLDEQMLKS